MKITGIITEYNPLHNGHILHMNEIKKNNPDLIINVMSGSLTSRGDLSLFDKFEKTRQALEAGCDIVIELEAVISMERADIFAYNTVTLLHKMGVTEITAGSEENNINIYKDKYESFQSESMDSSLSMKNNYTSLSGLSSNDTLGFFYYKTIRDNSYPILLTTIKRMKSGYLDSELKDDSVASASAIRNNIDKLEQYVPSYVSDKKDEILDENLLFPYLKYKILSSTLEELKKIFFVDEGIEYKLKDIKDYTDFASFTTYLSGKKYTKARMKRMLMYILFNITKEESQKWDLPIRILGYSEKGREYLNSIKKNVTFYTNIKEGISPVLDTELKITKLLDMVYHKNLIKKEQEGPVLK